MPGTYGILCRSMLLWYDFEIKSKMWYIFITAHPFYLRDGFAPHEGIIWGYSLQQDLDGPVCEDSYDEYAVSPPQM